MLFSQRKGLKLAKKAVQLDGVDEELRNSLWSAFHLATFNNWQRTEYGFTSPESSEVNALLERLWLNHFKLPIDEKPYFDQASRRVRDYFFKCKWNELYDLLEFCVKNLNELSSPLSEMVNQCLERENSAYRFVDTEIVQITGEVEIEAIEQGIDGGSGPVKSHLSTSLSLLSERKKKPDYRNSVKEAISAVEAACRHFSGNKKATLGDALKELDAETPLHEAFKGALLKLYGFTSDEHGIRHSLLQETSISYADAKFMLVACAAFCSYLLGKAAEKGK